MSVLAPPPKHTPITRDMVSDPWGRWFDQLLQNSAVSALGSALADGKIFVGNSSGVATAVSASGDLTLVNTGAFTLATVATAGTTGGSTAIPVITIDAKGRTTSITTAAVIAPAGTLTGTTLASNVVTSSLTSVGTLISGTWNASTIAVGYGGTGLSAVGTASQIFGTNAGATGYEHKAVTVTLAGAMAGITTLNASGTITTSAGNFAATAGNLVVSDGYGVNAGTDYDMLTRSGTSLVFGDSPTGGNWTTAEYIVGTQHTFQVGATQRLTITGTTVAITDALTVSLTSLLTGAVTASSTMTVADNMAIGGAILDYNALTVTGAIMSGSTSQNGLVVDVTTISSATAFARGGYFKISTAAASFTCAEMNTVEAAEPTVGAGSAITSLRMFYANAVSSVATNKYGLFIEGIAGGASINRAIQTGTTGDVLFGYLAGSGTRLVTASSTGLLAATTAAAFGLATGTGTTNTGVKWTDGANGVLGNGSWTDDGTTWAIGSVYTITVASGNTNVVGNFLVNTNKFTVTASTGNTSVAGTLDVTGLSTFTNRIKTTHVSGNTTPSIQIASTSPAFEWNRTDAGADERLTRIATSGTAFLLQSRTDAGASGRTLLLGTRSGVGWTDISYGNATDNNTNTWLGTGLGTYGGAFTITGVLTASSTTDSSSSTTGGTIISGGAGIAKKLFVGTSITAGGAILSTSASGGVGYTTGAGSTVTQGTSRTTGVTINAICGAITLVSAAGTTTWQTFTVTNSAVAATDDVLVVQKSGTDLNMISVTNVAAGSFKISFATTGGTTTEQPVFKFAVIKAVEA